MSYSATSQESNLNPTRIAEGLFKQSMGQTMLFSMMKTGNSGLIRSFNDLVKTGGDTLMVPTLNRLDGRPVYGDNRLEGNEVKQSYGRDYVRINQVRHAVMDGGAMSRQLLPFDLHAQTKEQLAELQRETYELDMLNHLTCNTALSGIGSTNGIEYLGNNEVIDPDLDHYFIIDTNGDLAPASAVNDLATNFTANGKLQLKHLDQLKTNIESFRSKNSQAIRPIKVDGKEFLLVLVSPKQLQDLRSDPLWTNINIALLQGGKDIMLSNFFSGAAGVYNGMVIKSTDYLPYGVGNNGTTVIKHAMDGSVAVGGKTCHRVVICGAEALSFATGQVDNDLMIGYSPDFGMGYANDRDDYGNLKKKAIISMYGIKSVRFNNKLNSIYLIAVQG
jgi:N4-gp56 family major capsid protein